MHEAKFRKWSHSTQFAWAKLCSLERTQMTKVGKSTLSVHSAHAWACGLKSIMGSYNGRSLKRRVVRLSEASSGSSKTHEFSNPFSSKNPILIFWSPKMNYKNAYRFYIQQCTIKNIKQQHQSANQLISQQLHFLQKPNSNPSIQTNHHVKSKIRIITILLLRDSLTLT